MLLLYNFLGYYQDLIILLTYLWVMCMATAYIIARYALPTFVNLKIGKLRGTLGFYFISFWFVYMCIPFLFSFSDKLLGVYNNNAQGISQFVGIVLMFYFGSKQQTPSISEKTE